MSNHSASDPSVSRQPMSVAQKRYAIAQGLRPYLHDDYLNEVMAYWETHYSQQPAFAVQRFLNDICQSPMLKSQRAYMLQSVVQQLSQPSIETYRQTDAATDASSQHASQDRSQTADTATVDAGSPEQAIAALDAAAQLENTQQSHEQACFETLTTTLLSRSGQDHAIRRYMLDQLGTLQLSAETTRFLRGWLAQQHGLHNISLTQHSMQQLVNLTYVGLCEYLGPTKADRLVALTVQSLESQEPDWPVRSFL